MARQEFLSGTAEAVVEDVLARVLRSNTNLTTPRIQEIQREVTEGAEKRISEFAPKGPMASITVLSGLGGLGAGMMQVYLGYTTGNSEMLYTGAVSVVAAIGVIYGRMTATKVVKMVKSP